MKTTDKERLYTIEDLENLLEYLPYEIWLKDKDGKHVYINQKGADKIGLKKEDMFEAIPKHLHNRVFMMHLRSESCKNKVIELGLKIVKIDL